MPCVAFDTNLLLYAERYGDPREGTALLQMARRIAREGSLGMTAANPFAPVPHSLLRAIFSP